jgi:enterochelin esterase-like enzyme
MAVNPGPAVGLTRPRPRATVVSAAALATVFAVVGLLGTVRYLDNYWLYRGFPPPRDPAFVHAVGTTERFSVASTALGGRRQPVDVYLPPGYEQHPERRYAVVYLLHGFPGRPGAFLQTVRAGVVEDILLARHRIQPLILVMPFGSTGTFDDKEWANGIGRDDAWETFVARDVVGAVDDRYRTIRNGAGRALVGLSEGAYGALNIGLHHLGEFHVLESWSGYEKADDIRSIFGRDRRLLVWNSPLTQLPLDAPALRRAHTFVWLYSGTTDALRPENGAFANALSRDRIPHTYFVVRGGHNWAVWRGEASRALLAASRHLSHV